jgi:hypothetical protein
MRRMDRGALVQAAESRVGAMSVRRCAAASLGAVPAARQLATQAFARRGIFVGDALTLDIAALGRGLVENVVGGLDQ